MLPDFKVDFFCTISCCVLCYVTFTFVLKRMKCYLRDDFLDNTNLHALLIIRMCITYKADNNLIIPSKVKNSVSNIYEKI